HRRAKAWPMHLATPRIAPLADDQLTPEQAAALAPVRAGGRPALNIFRTLAHAPEALTAFLAWGSYLLSKRNSLPAREREIVILRTGFLCRSGYEWTQHAEIGLRAGLTGDDLARIKAGAEGWPPADSALIRA